jgi:predicted DNA-binding transcriptional regulator AlpA
MTRAISELPKSGFVRVWQFLGDPKATPPVPAMLPMGRSTWWKGVREGRFPKPLKLGPRTTVWRVEDIRALLENPEQAA